MEFWGVEVKTGVPLKVSPGEGKLIHLSQASIGESNKGNNESIPVYVNVDGQRLVLGTLSAGKFPQIQYDLVFDKDFELSHHWKNGSIFFCGYKTQNPVDDEVYPGGDFESGSEDEDLALENGNPDDAAAKPKVEAEEPAAKPKVKAEEPVKDGNADSDDDSSDEVDSSDEELALENGNPEEPAAKPKVKAVGPVKDVNADIDDDSSDEVDSSDEEDSSDGSDDQMETDDDSDENDSSDEEDEETPTPKKESKKRPTDPVSKTPVPSKKAKFATPQKTDGKKVAASVHVATPHPAKQAAKTPASAGKVSCGTCSKSFNSDKALESHSKAKHAVK